MPYVAAQPPCLPFAAMHSSSYGAGGVGGGGMGRGGSGFDSSSMMHRSSACTAVPGAQVCWCVGGCRCVCTCIRISVCILKKKNALFRRQQNTTSTAISVSMSRCARQGCSHAATRTARGASASTAYPRCSVYSLYWYKSTNTDAAHPHL